MIYPSILLLSVDYKKCGEKKFIWLFKKNIISICIFKRHQISTSLCILQELVILKICTVLESR